MDRVATDLINYFRRDGITFSGHPQIDVDEVTLPRTVWNFLSKYPGYHPVEFLLPFIRELERHGALVPFGIGEGSPPYNQRYVGSPQKTEKIVR